jgi:hypothetical protein
MEDFLDIVWFKIIDFFHYISNLLDAIFAPLNSLGPGFTIFIIALFTVVITKILTGTFKTRRYRELKKEFEHWFNIRQEALKCDDPEKAKFLAKNIDQAKLNQVYWDYFLEGFLISLVTRLLPIVLFFAYVNKAYKLENLIKLFGREYVFKFTGYHGKSFFVGAGLWFVISILLIYLCWFIIKRFTIRKQTAIIFLFLSISAWGVINPTHALATQSHGAPEGIYAHQIAHIFFMLSMVFFIHWLRDKKLVKETGWRYIQYAAFFLILWNIDAFLVHLLNDQLQLVQILNINSSNIHLSVGNGSKGLETLFYFAKLDHLFCVPALLFLYSGLKRLLKASHSEISRPENQRNGWL